METVIAGVSSNFKGDNLEINEHASEALRRLMAEKYFTENGTETDEIPFDAATFDAQSLTELAQFGRGFLPEFEQAGFSSDEIKGFSSLLDNLEKLAAHARDFGITYVYDDALPEEEFHVEDLRSGRTDLESLSELQKSPFWDAGGRFDSEYPGLSVADKASEIAADERCNISLTTRRLKEKKNSLRRFQVKILHRSSAAVSAEFWAAVSRP